MSIITQRRKERAARLAEAERQLREKAQEEQLTPWFDPMPQTVFEIALAQAISAGAEQLRSDLA
jgi:hypothetical protein